MGFPLSITVIIFNQQYTEIVVLIIFIPFSYCLAFLTYLKKRGLPLNAVVELTNKTVECLESKTNIRAVFHQISKRIRLCS